jgi:MFS family permease
VSFGASAIGWNGVYLAEVARRAPEGMASMATGGTLAFTFLGVVIGPPIFGALSTWFGTYRAGFMGLSWWKSNPCFPKPHKSLPGVISKTIKSGCRGGYDHVQVHF